MSTISQFTVGQYRRYVSLGSLDILVSCTYMIRNRFVWVVSTVSKSMVLGGRSGSSSWVAAWQAVLRRRLLISPARLGADRPGHG